MLDKQETARTTKGASGLGGGLVAASSLTPLVEIARKTVYAEQHRQHNGAGQIPRQTGTGHNPTGDGTSGNIDAQPEDAPLVEYFTQTGAAERHHGRHRPGAEDENGQKPSRNEGAGYCPPNTFPLMPGMVISICMSFLF